MSTIATKHLRAHVNEQLKSQSDHNIILDLETNTDSTA